MIELTLPPTPEGTAASQQVIDALDSANIEYEAYEEKDGSVSFDFGDSDQDAVLDIMRGLGIDVEHSTEDDPQGGDPMYRTEQLIEAVMHGANPCKILEDNQNPPGPKGPKVGDKISFRVGNHIQEGVVSRILSGDKLVLKIDPEVGPLYKSATFVQWEEHWSPTKYVAVKH